MTPKPDIVLQQDTSDPLYKATRAHFANLMRNYQYPIYCFNLTKMFNQREAIVANPYNKVVNDIINLELPKQVKINFTHYDVKAKKKEEKDFPNRLLKMGSDAMDKTGFFHILSSKHKLSRVKLQRGIIRTNCIDSLDRTNFAQEMFGYIAALK